jgi:hypothetical protein
MFPGSDSHKLIGLSHFPHLALKPGLPYVAHLGELEIISIFDDYYHPNPSVCMLFWAFW